MLGGKDVNSGLGGKNLSGFGKFSSYGSYKYFSSTVHLLVLSLTCLYNSTESLAPIMCHDVRPSVRLL